MSSSSSSPSSTNTPTTTAVSMSKSVDNQEWDVDLYQEKHSFVFEYGSSLIDLLEPKPKERILDVGCGSGELTNQISEQYGALAIGIDADPSMVQRAQERFPGTKFIQADVRDIPPLYDNNDDDNGLVDAIFSNAALHWVKDADAAVASMSRVLKPGGRFVVEFGGKGNIGAIVRASLQIQNLRPETDSPYFFPSIAEYSTLLEKYNIEVLSACIFDRPTLLTDGENGMRNWLEMFGDVLFERVGTEEEKEKLQEQVLDLLRPNLYKDGQWTADYRRIRIVGRKEGDY